MASWQRCTHIKQKSANLYIVNLLDNNNVFEVFPHQVDLYLMKTTVTRWCDIERAVRNKENLDLLHKFRLSIKIICNTLGCDICIPPLPLLHAQAHEKAAMRTAREPMRTAAERKDCPKGRALGNKKVNQQKLGSRVEIKNLAKSISF